VLKDPKLRNSRKLYRHIVYVVPTCSNPSGRTMSLRRREQLVRIARTYNALIICDDVYDFLQWPLTSASSSEPLPQDLRLPRLSDIDLALGPSPSDPLHFGHAVSNGTFSKIVGPGVRTGWVEAAPAFAHGLGQTGSSRSGGAPSQLCAALMWALLRDGALQRHIDEVTRPELRRRHGIMLDAVRRFLPAGAVTVAESSRVDRDAYGGYFIWITLRGSVSAGEIARRAREVENLIIAPGELFQVSGDEKAAGFSDKIRLTFSWESEEDLVEGVRRLGRVLSSLATEARTPGEDRAFAVDDYK
jgi:DNA-binding transcriptional MocR family regulator